MKRTTIVLFASAMLFIVSSCGDQATDDQTAESQVEASEEESTEDDGLVYRGEKITPDGAITPAELVAAMEGEETLEAKIEAEVTGVCKKKGCWMTVDLGDGETMRVTFKDYGFFMPLDCEGRTAIMEGVARVQTISVDDLQHFAEDAGKSDEEIDAITEPETALAFEATGVILK